jgi:hypothetical protein
MAATAMKARPMENSTWSRCGLPYIGRYSVRSSTPPQQRDDDEGERQAGQERHAQLLHREHREVAAGHGEGAVREVDEVHQAQRHGQPDREHEQQHAVGDAVEKDGEHEACPSPNPGGPDRRRESYAKAAKGFMTARQSFPSAVSFTQPSRSSRLAARSGIYFVLPGSFTP